MKKIIYVSLCVFFVTGFIYAQTPKKSILDGDFHSKVTVRGCQFSFENVERNVTARGIRTPNIMIELKVKNTTSQEMDVLYYNDIRLQNTVKYRFPRSYVRGRFTLRDGVKGTIQNQTQISPNMCKTLFVYVYFDKAEMIPSKIKYVEMLFRINKNKEKIVNHNLVIP